MPVIHIPDTATSNDIDNVNEYLDTDNPSFVLLYMNGCGPCSQTHPQWKKLEKNFSDNDKIGIFDIEMSRLGDIKNQKLADNVMGFPTMRYIKGNVCEDYEKCDGLTTDRSYDSFVDWINKKNGDKSILLMGGKKKSKRKRNSKKSKTKRTRRKSRKSKKKRSTRKKGSKRKI